MKKYLLPLSLLLVCILAFTGTGDPRPDARKDLVFDALYTLHTEGYDPTEYTAYDWNGTVIDDFYAATAAMDAAELQAYCLEHIQKLTRLEIRDETTLRGEPMKTGCLTCTEGYYTPTTGQYLSLQFTLEASAIYNDSGDAFAYTYTPQANHTQYTLPEGWTCGTGGMGYRESIRKTDGHAYFQYQRNYYATHLGIRHDIGQSNYIFTIAP